MTKNSICADFSSNRLQAPGPELSREIEEFLFLVKCLSTLTVLSSPRSNSAAIKQGE